MSITPIITSGQTDHWLETPAGRVFARTWSLADNKTSASAGPAPIVLMHESLGCVDLWRDFPAALSQATQRPVVAYDRPGFGRSDAQAQVPPATFIEDEASATFAAVLDHLGIERFIVFGHSVGGGMAVYCAAHHGERCVALISEAAQGFLEDQTLQGIAEAQRQFAREDQLARLARLHGDKTRWILDAWWENWLSPAFAHWSLEAALPSVKCPVLAIHGADDEYGSVQQAHFIARLAGGPAQVKIMPDTRHVPHRERPQAVLAMIGDFLQEMP